MNLQKNDKIILVVGVIILIAAAGAIAIYTTQSNGDKDNHMDQSEKIMTYDVSWDLETKELDSSTYTLNPPGIFSLLSKGKSVSDNNCFTIDQDQYNIKSIEINVSFTDNKMGLPILGLIFKGALPIGKDTLTVAIITPNEEEHKATIVGNGKATITIEGKVRPFSTSIYAKSLEEAQTKLEENYSKEFTGESFKLTASLKISERILLLNRIIERFSKDTFKIDIKCHYYKYTLEEIMEEDNQDNNGDGDKETGTGIGDFYHYMSYGRQMI
jgi:hypothetical protein